MQTQEIQTIQQGASELAFRAQGLAVHDQATADKAAEYILAGKEMVRKIKAFFTPLKEAARASWQGLVDQEKRELSKLEPAIDRLNRDISAWRTAEERKRREAEEARRRQETERRRLEEEALRKAQEEERRAAEEKQRLEEEAGRRELEARAQAETAKDAETRRRAEEEAARIRREAEEKKAEEDRRAREAQDAIIAQAAAQEKTFEPMPVIPETPKTDGLIPRTYWRAEVVNFGVLLEAVLAGTVAREAVVPNMPYLNDLAGKVKNQVTVPGVRIWSEIKMVEIGRRGARK